MKKMLALVMAVLMLMASFSAVAEEPKVIRFGHSYDATTLDPQNCYDDGSYYVINNIVETLVVCRDKEIHPGVAETWEVSEDGLVYTFHLRQSNWSDGTPLTANDFVYAAKRVLDPTTAYENAYSFYSLKNGEAYNLGNCAFEDVGVKALDDYTLEYTLEYPSATAIYAFGGYAYAPMNQAACEKYGTAYGAEAENLLTNGPFTCTEWLHESKITIKKNPNYWNAENVKIDEVQYIIGASGQVAVDLFMAGDLDVGTFYDYDSIDTLTMLGMESTSRLSGYNFLHFNVAGGSEATAPFMSNANFRKAISAAISREDIMRVANVVAQPAHRITAPTLVVADGRGWEEAYPMQGWSTKAEPEKAKEYLNAALAEIGATLDQVPEIQMVCFDSQANMVKLQAVQDMIYQAIGVNCVISPQPIQQMFDMINNGQFDMWVGGKTLETPDWLGQVAYEYSDTPGAISRYDSAAFNELYSKAERTPSMEERNELMNEMEKIIVEEMLTLHLYWSEDYTIFVPGVTGIGDLDGYGPYFATADIVK